MEVSAIEPQRSRSLGPVACGAFECARDPRVLELIDRRVKRKLWRAGGVRHRRRGDLRGRCPRCHAEAEVGLVDHDELATSTVTRAEGRAEDGVLELADVARPPRALERSTASAPIRAMELERADTIHLLLAFPLPASPAPPVAELALRLLDLERWLCEHLHFESNELIPRALQVEISRT